MKDWTQEGTVSPYLMKPLRSHAEAQADIRRHDDAIAEAIERNREFSLIAFPTWRRRSLRWLHQTGRGLRRPA